MRMRIWEDFAKAMNLCLVNTSVGNDGGTWTHENWGTKSRKQIDVKVVEWMEDCTQAIWDARYHNKHKKEAEEKKREAARERKAIAKLGDSSSSSSGNDSNSESLSSSSESL